MIAQSAKMHKQSLAFLIAIALAGSAAPADEILLKTGQVILGKNLKADAEQITMLVAMNDEARAGKTGETAHYVEMSFARSRVQRYKLSASLFAAPPQPTDENKAADTAEPEPAPPANLGGDSASTEEANEFKKLIQNTYNFRPADLSPEQQKEKRLILDAFFKKVLADKDKFLPLLRQELKERSNNPYFYYDAAGLLFMNAQGKEDRQICANALGQVRLEDLSQEHFFKLSIDLGKSGCDIFPSIQKILDYPEFSVFIVEHNLTLNQNLATLYCCLQIDDDFYLDKLISRLQTEEEIQTAKTIILVLMSTVSVKAQAALAAFAQKTDKTELKDEIAKIKYNSKSELPVSKKVPLQFDLTKLIEAYKNYSTDATMEEQRHDALPYYVTKNNYSAIKQTRREVAYRLSDEAVSEIAFLTYLLKLSFTSAD